MRKTAYIKCIVLIFLASNFSYGQARSTGGGFSQAGSPVFQVGDIVRYGQNVFDRENRLTLYLSREDVIRYLRADSALLDYQQHSIHRSKNINNRGETASISLPLLERIFTFGFDWDRTRSLELVIESGHQLMFRGERRFNEALRHLPLDVLQGMQQSGDRFMFITNTYHVSSGRLVERRGQTIEIVADSASVSFSRPLSTDSIVFVGNIPAAYNMMPIDRNRLCRAIREQGGVCIRRHSLLAPLGLKQIRNDQQVLGYTLAVSQIAVPLAFVVHFNNLANRSYRNHKNLIAQSLAEHDTFFNNYRRYRYATFWVPAVSFAVLYAVNIFFNYNTNIRIQRQQQQVRMQPQVFNDEMGNLGMGMSLSFNF